jgi:hypothetical protein
MKLNSIKTITGSDYVNMGPVRLRQPIPSQEVAMVDPFILLHHYGPYEISEENNPFDLGPHPHRGFEPITFLIQGEQLHRDSLGNKSVVRAGDVQWTTAGRGIVHAEGPTKDFVQKGGVLEGIQLWLNLPANKKMMQPNYQHVKSADFAKVVSEDGKVTTQVIAGVLNDSKGKMLTQTPVNAYMIHVEKGGQTTIPIASNQQALVYLIKGKTIINIVEELELNNNQLAIFSNDGEGFSIKGEEDSMLLFLSGEPLKEKVASWGPYVMNTQTEIMEALRDYQMGKMGFLPA